MAIFIDKPKHIDMLNNVCIICGIFLLIIFFYLNLFKCFLLKWANAFCNVLSMIDTFTTYLLTYFLNLFI